MGLEGFDEARGESGAHRKCLVGGDQHFAGHGRKGERRTGAAVLGRKGQAQKAGFFVAVVGGLVAVGQGDRRVVGVEAEALAIPLFVEGEKLVLAESSVLLEERHRHVEVEVGVLLDGCDLSFVVEGFEVEANVVVGGLVQLHVHSDGWRTNGGDAGASSFTE